VFFRYGRRALGFFLLVLSQGSAANMAEKSQHLLAVQSSIRVLDRRVNEISVEKQDLVDRLASVEKSMGNSAARLKQLKKQVRQSEQARLQLGIEIQSLLQLLVVQREHLQEQINAAYILGKQSRLKLILNQEDPARTSRMMIYYGYLNQARVERLQAVKVSLEKLKALQILEKIHLKEFQSLVVEQTQECELLEKNLSQRQQLLMSLVSDEQDQLKALVLLKMDEKRLQQLFLEIQESMDDFPYELNIAQEFSEQRGRLGWPVSGAVIKTFGARRSASRWDGIVISAEEGVEVKSVSRGRVVFSDWLRGYGLMIIIDHGKDFMTLYAFNQSLYKDVGDWVDVGDVIATVGKSGGRNTAGLYFGVRDQGSPLDPQKWLKSLSIH
jgi:septal ring factor EnvC (AmiA/AmiB activator)